MRARLHSLARHLLTEHTEPTEVGRAVALGLFVGTLPLYGLHLPLCIGLAWLLNLNKATVYLAANISNPIIAPVLVAAGIAIGESLRHGQVRGLDLAEAQGFLESLWLLGGQLPDLYLSCLLGDAVLGAVLAVIGGPLAAAWVRRRRVTQEPE